VWLWAVARDALALALGVGIAAVTVAGVVVFGRALARVPGDLVRDAARAVARLAVRS